MADKKDSDLPSVADILKKSGKANKPGLNEQYKRTQKNSPTRPEGLEELLKKGQKAHTSQPKIKKGGGARAANLPNIEALINARPQPKPSTKTNPSLSNNPRQSHEPLQKIIGSLSQKNTTSQSTQARDTGGHNKNRKVFSFALIGLLAVTFTVLFMRYQTQESLPESAVAQQLMSIVNGIENYRLERNRMPEMLAELPEFPQGAIEWPVDQYDIQLETSALELFLLKDSTGYIVMSRYGNEAWMYTEKGKPKLRKVPAR